MDRSELRDGNFVIDIESGRMVCEEASTTDTLSIMVSGENGVDLVRDIENGGALSPEHVKEGDLANKTRKERRKSTKTNAKKPPRPPLKGLSLDAADQKLIKEIAALAMMKRARIERMKALKKMKATKSSSSTAIFFTLFTLIFCVLVVFQGMSCRNCSSSRVQGLTETIGPAESLSMIQYHKSLYVTGSESPSLVEQVSGSEVMERASSLSSII